MSDNLIELTEQRSTISSFPARSRLLVVDDEPLILEGLTRLLATRDYDVVTANGGCEALIAIGKQQFDAILLDLGMPDLSGNEVLRFVADRSAETPVIVVSGDSTIDAAIRALRGGAADFVRKPYEPEELLRRIDNTLTQRRLERENNHILQRLQQSEKWHRFLVNSSPDFIYTLDCEGRFTFVNDRVESLIGYRREDLLGQHYSLVIHEDDIARAEHIFNERRSGDRNARNNSNKAKSGNPEKYAGWFLDLPVSSGADGDSAERIVGDALVRGGKIIVTSYVPDCAPCSGGGHSWLYILDGCNGDSPMERMEQEQPVMARRFKGKISDRPVVMKDPLRPRLDRIVFSDRAGHAMLMEIEGESWGRVYWRKDK